MTEGQQFFLILCVLYLSECVLWVKPQAWAFLSGWWGRWKVSPPARHGARGRFVLCQPFPPLGWGFVCGEVPEADQRVGVADVRARLDTFHTAADGLRRLTAWVVLPWFFGAVPVTYWRFGAVPLFWIVLGLGWGTLIVTSVVFFRAHRRLYPDKRSERWQHTILSAVVPQHAIRGPGVLARPCLADCAPLAVAAAVMEGSAFRSLVGKEYRKIVFPPPRRATSDGGYDGSATGSGSRTRSNAEAILREAGLEPPALLAPPVRQGDAIAYCPRCHVQFAEVSAHCADCGGMEVALLP